MAYRYTNFTPLVSAWSTIFFLSAIGLLIGVLLSFVRPLEYSSTLRLQVTQELGAVDAYTAARSAERIADDLGQAVYFSDFYEEILQTNSAIDQSYFPDEENKFRRAWERTLVTSVSRGTGLLSIRAYHPDVQQAQALVLAVGNLLTEKGWTYTSGSNISIRLVDEPVNSRYPVRPNLLVNAFSGLLLGGLAGIGYVLIEVERVKRRHQLIHGED